MSTAIERTDVQTETKLALYNSELVAAMGSAANAAAADNVFNRYQEPRRQSTLDAQLSDLAVFIKFLEACHPDVKLTADNLYSDPIAWYGVTWGLVDGFKSWMMQRGDSVASVNRRLSTVRKYAKLAATSLNSNKSAMARDAAKELTYVTSVSGYAKRDIQTLDEKRNTEPLTSRKTESTAIAADVANLLTSQELDSPAAYRDNVLMSLLVDHGLRASECADLTVDGVDLANNTITFERRKVRGTKKGKATQQMMPRLRRAIEAYIQSGFAPVDGSFLRGNTKGGKLTDKPMTRVSVSQRAARLGKDANIAALSSHDCRHYSAEEYVRKNKNATIADLCDWFGWNSPAMALVYLSSADVAKRK